MQQDETFGIREAFRREPDQAAFLLKLGLGGAIAVAVFSTVVALLLNALMAAPVTLALALLYGLVLALSAARLMGNSLGRRFAERGLAGRQAGSGPSAPRDGQEAPLTPFVREQAFFNEVYFMLRLQEEVAAARRDGREMCLVSIDATVPGTAMTMPLAEKIAVEFARLASDHHKTIGHVLSVSESEYLLSLPMLDAKETKAFVSKVVQALGNYWCHFGTAVYPADATNAEGMVRYARAAVEQSRQGKSNSKKHAVA